jgi:AraC-like DNA-binding protein
LVEEEGGYALERVCRAGAVRDVLDAAPEPPDLAAAAAGAGYADQAHLTRECSSLSGLTPTGLVRARQAPPERQASGGSAIMAVPISRKPSRA